MRTNVGGFSLKITSGTPKNVNIGYWMIVYIFNEVWCWLSIAPKGLPRIIYIMKLKLIKEIFLYSYLIEGALTLSMIRNAIIEHQNRGKIDYHKTRNICLLVSSNLLGYYQIESQLHNLKMAAGIIKMWKYVIVSFNAGFQLHPKSCTAYNV